MKSELRAVPHSVLPDQFVFEVWYDGRFIATVAGADGPGVRIITKHPLEPFRVAGKPNILEVRIDASMALLEPDSKETGVNRSRAASSVSRDLGASRNAAQAREKAHGS
ncbi:MAG: hypothetical protein L0Y72_18585 [Gemmataceae bacterium]|nr:hypothetical protein [Gemmataceae bacterium]